MTPLLLTLDEAAAALGGISVRTLEREIRDGQIAVVHVRDLRRTYGSWIVQRTGSLKAAQDLLGHTSSAITSRHYAHLLTEHLAAAVATLDAPAVGQKRGKRGND